jgi:hypothetical protein
METFDDIMLTQVKRMIRAGVRDGETVDIFEIFLDHTFTKCPGDITLQMWDNLYEEMSTAFPHVDAKSVIDVMMERGYYLADMEEQPDYIVSWWRTHMMRHRMIKGQ